MSENGILTSHAGSLPRPEDLLQLYRDDVPSETLNPQLTNAVAEVVRRQADLGIAVVNDGEYGKPMSGPVDYGAWASYAYGRLSGYEPREAPTTNPARMGGEDFNRFSDFYTTEYQPRLSPRRRSANQVICTGPITYVGHAELQRDIDNLKHALEASSIEGSGFLSAVATGLVPIEGTYYKNREEQAAATAVAMREEYKAITDAGLSVQIDDPILVDQMLFQFSELPYERWAAMHVEMVNHALEGIPEDQVRYHICWGSWPGPHSTDTPLRDVVQAMLRVKASQYSVEAANVRHEHEWKVWQDVRLPEGKTLMPGVVTHKTNVLEHPELVADRIIRYAEVVGRERVIAGTDCGMGGRIHPSIAWAKLESLVLGARLATEHLWRN